MSAAPALTRRAVFTGAVPIMLANALAPIVSFVDLWVVGNFMGKTALAAIVLGVAIFGFFYWGFGFLRMSTSGLSAQADGANDGRAVQAHLMRAVPLGFCIGCLILLFQVLILAIFFIVFPAEGEVLSQTKTYLSARLWGLPAMLAGVALMGWFIGLSRPVYALYMQIVLNVINAVLSIFFAIGLGWGVFGVGIASAFAEWCGLLAGLCFAVLEIKRRGGLDKGVLTKRSLFNVSALKALGTANGNIFIRTMALNFGFLFFMRAATQQGTVFLAGFGVLMQLITMSALVLDSFANVAEAHVGAAYGAKDEVRFNRAVRLTTESSYFFAVLCSLAIYFGGPFLIDFLTTAPDVRQSARTYLLYCALAPIIGAGAWQLDGVFIGITRTGAMRNAGVVAVAIYLCAHYMLEPQFGGAGIWMAFLIYYVARALTLLPAWANIKRDLRI